MHRTVRSVAVVVMALVGIGVTPSHSQVTGILDQEWEGQVSVRWDADTGATVVTVDVDHDARVDVAFRLQHSGPVRSYLGPATIHYRQTSLVVAPTDGNTLVFVVSGHEAAVAAMTTAPSTAVAGLAFFSRPPDGDSTEVARSLLRDLCPSSLSITEGGRCASCDDGGPGQPSCTEPSSGACTVTCMDGTFACCNSPNSCRCCAESQERQP